jgi:hypothetical protein
MKAFTKYAFLWSFESLLRPINDDIGDTLDPDKRLCALYNLDHVILQLFIVSFYLIG